MPSTASPSRESTHGLKTQGLAPKGAVRWNSNPPELVAAAIRRGEGELADMGPFVAVTTPHTGRSPKDKYLVRESSSEKDVDWGAVNQPMTEAQFGVLLGDVRGYLDSCDELFVQDLYCGADPAYRLSCRYVTPNAWHAHFVRNMFIRPELAELASFEPNFTRVTPRGTASARPRSS
jgi:phosphoenolpyruvate carboxykinase (ATP)